MISWRWSLEHSGCPYGVAIWLVVASIAAANGAIHLWAMIKTRRYSPGVVTGCIIYLPLAVFGFSYFWRTGLASTPTLVQAALIGPAYNLMRRGITGGAQRLWRPPTATERNKSGTIQV